jgi:uncharacterized membrane protein YGL010W
MLAGKSWERWIEEYEQGHQHPVNRLCHRIGIPMLLVSLLVGAAALLDSRLWLVAALLFLFGWIFQFVGHVAERKPPEFFKDWRFLLVGARWWLYSMRSRR